MLEIPGNIWKMHAQGSWVVITTNSSVTQQGLAIMGKGVALQAKQKFPKLPMELGRQILLHGNLTYAFGKYQVITLPVKRAWHEPADPELIQSSCEALVTLATSLSLSEVYLVRPGCGAGGLIWADVKPIIQPLLDDRFYVVGS